LLIASERINRNKEQMSQVEANPVGATLKRILVSPTADDLWQLQADLLALGTDAADSLLGVAREFHGCLRNLESKVGSRNASRWGAILATASVTSVGLQEMLAEQQAKLKRLLASGVTAFLEIASATKSVEAWELEASLMYFDVAWYLYGELWNVSLSARPELSADERRVVIQELVKPLLDTDTPDSTKSTLVVGLFQVVLAARVSPLLSEATGR
jgi:hypothetical protein